MIEALAELKWTLSKPVMRGASPLSQKPALVDPIFACATDSKRAPIL